MGEAIKEAGSCRRRGGSMLTSTSSHLRTRAGCATSDGTCRCPSGHRQLPWPRRRAGQFLTISARNSVAVRWPRSSGMRFSAVRRSRVQACETAGRPVV